MEDYIVSKNNKELLRFEIELEGELLTLNIVGIR